MVDDKKKLTRAGIAALIAESMGMTVGFANETVNEIFDILGDALREGRVVEIRRFGTFAPVTRSARVFTVPGTNEKVAHQSRVTVRFTPARSLRDMGAHGGGN